MKRIIVINGPNLNMLGVREPGIYGTLSLKDIEDKIRRQAEELGVSIAFINPTMKGTLLTAFMPQWVRQTGSC